MIETRKSPARHQSARTLPIKSSDADFPPTLAAVRDTVRKLRKRLGARFVERWLERAIASRNARTELSIRQRRYIQGRIAGLCQYRAAIAAGYSPPTARNAFIKIEAKPLVRAALQEWMHREGISDFELMKGVDDGSAKA